MERNSKNSETEKAQAKPQKIIAEAPKKVAENPTPNPVKPTAGPASDLSSVEAFKNLGILGPILRSIAEQGFEKPTEIQRKTIPLLLSGRDLIARAATGSGKTLAFGSGIIQNSEMKKGLQALVLTPTRELAIQDSKALKEFSKYKPLRVVAVYGGVPIGAQIRALRDVDVVVGTPGRLLDQMNRGVIQLEYVKILVLDEADRMLDMGFIDDVQKIINACPKDRQTLLFSATVSSGVANLARKYMRNPQQVFAESYVDPNKLKQCYYDIDDRLKFSLLLHLLKSEKSELVMVFCNTRRFVDFVAKHLNEFGVNAMAIHGGFRQSKRTKTMNRFHSQNVQVLVCTDVAARGLDIPMVSHIYNLDIPIESKQYIHRIGRTARAGKEGKVINIVGSRDHENFRRVKRENNVNITRAETPPIQKVNVQMHVSEKPGQGYARRGRSRQGYSGSGKPGHGYARRGRSRQGYSGSGKSGQGYSGSGKPGQGYSGSGKSGHGYVRRGKPGQGFKRRNSKRGSNSGNRKRSSHPYKQGHTSPKG